MTRGRADRGVIAALLLGLAASGCSPTFDWREARLGGDAVVSMFPCRPDRQERGVRVAGTSVRMQLHSCAAGDARFSIALVDVPGAFDVAPVLRALREQAASNVGGRAESTARSAVPGATPYPGAGSVVISGRRPDGSAVVEHAVFFVRGLRVFQATVLVGTERPPPEEAIATFFASIRLP